MERQTQEPSLAASPDSVADIQVRRAQQGLAVVNQHSPDLLGDEDPPRPVARMCDRSGARQAAEDFDKVQFAQVNSGDCWRADSKCQDCGCDGFLD